MAKILAIVVKDMAGLPAAVKLVDRVKFDKPVLVSVDYVKDDRSAAQNRLYWCWITDCQNTSVNEHAGNDKDWWHLFFKEHSLLNIYIRDNVNGTADTMAALYDVKINCGVDTYNNMKKFVIENISTTDANVSQFTEYLNDIERFCHSVGISLRTDPAIYKQAMGIK